LETSSEDPLASASRGALRGFLDWSEEKIKELVVKFNNRDIAFVEDPKTINLAKKQRKTSEWSLFIKYIEDPDLRILFQMGLTLRRLEKQQKQRESLRIKIHNKYGAKGLHIAQFIQNGFFGKYLGNILERTSTPQKLTHAHSPNTFIICSSWSAMKKCEQIKKNVMKRISGYDAELYKTEIKEIYFLNKLDEIPIG